MIASKQLPAHLQERMLEEWLAHAETLPGKMSRLFFAVQTVWAGHAIAHEIRLPEIAFWQIILKRCFDLVIASSFLVLGMPILLSAALVARMTTEKGKSILERQTIIGRDLKEFTIVTFRVTYESGRGKEFTPIGRFLRETRIDLLPFLVNVIRGDMSLVGPGIIPAGEFSLDEKRRLLEKRQAMKPGITGWALIKDDLTLRRDLWYVKNFSLFLDQRIFLRSIILALQRRGREGYIHASDLRKR